MTNIWLVESSEPIPEIDHNFRDLRCGMLAKSLAGRGHEVTWWSSTFSHMDKRHRFDRATIVTLESGAVVRLLRGPGYPGNKSPRRFIHQRAIAKAFFAEGRVVEQRPDVIFCCLPTIELAETAVRLGAFYGCPVVIDVRDLWPDHYLAIAPAFFRPVLKRCLFLEYHRAHKALAKATGIIAVSRSYLDWGLKLAGRPQHDHDGVFFLGFHPRNRCRPRRLASAPQPCVPSSGCVTMPL